MIFIIFPIKQEQVEGFYSGVFCLYTFRTGRV